MLGHERRNLKRGTVGRPAAKAERNYAHHEDSALAFSIPKHGAEAQQLRHQSANIVTRAGGRRHR